MKTKSRITLVLTFVGLLTGACHSDRHAAEKAGEKIEKAADG